MNVQKEEITAMKMLPALTPLVALSVLAKLALLEMESTAQVRFGLMNGSGCWRTALLRRVSLPDSCHFAMLPDST